MRFASRQYVDPNCFLHFKPRQHCSKLVIFTGIGRTSLNYGMLSTALWGIATSQMVKYYELYPKDKWPLKVYVAAAWTSNTLSLAFYNYYIYINTAKALSDCDIFYEYISNIGAFVWGLLFVPASLFTQGLYLYRIWMFGRESTTLITLNRALFYCVVSFVVLSMTSQTSIIVYQFVKDVSNDLDLQQPVFIGVMGSAIATDLSLTLSLVYLLLRHQIGALKGTKYIISRLVTYSLTTGTLCLTLAITGMTLAIVLPSTGYYNLFSVPLAPVYLNSLLAS
ncbi:hypothetical protein FISHEDRAFT_74003 [Fistulina hepatica ATCC 64428]|uniref:DUF6534 domain-containing protein n=1 Tax=Fistulina hepatica ATCC 64428 TaxID=1128425 RepID=A0A0D7ABN4_9AGAR|nr:hypothetical protein FISHEDRAFT_74003 [Fistulina hepatica ATCC 64428]